MVKLKPYLSTTQSLPSISNHTLQFPISNIKIHSPLRIPKSLRISQSNPSLKHHQIICARKRQWPLSPNRKMLQLASLVAFNLKILPEPLNSIIGEIARSNSNENRILNRLVRGLRTKSTKKRNGKKLLLSVFVLICVVGFWSWRVSELDLFLRLLFIWVIGISSISFLLRNRGVKEWFLGFLFGVVLMMGFRFGKEDVKLWVQKVRTCSPVAQIAMKNRSRKWRLSK